MGEEVFVGATDSSVPCSMMIHLAYILRAELQKHKDKVIFKFIYFDKFTPANCHK